MNDFTLGQMQAATKLLREEIAVNDKLTAKEAAAMLMEQDGTLTAGSAYMLAKTFLVMNDHVLSAEEQADFVNGQAAK